MTADFHSYCFFFNKKRIEITHQANRARSKRNQAPCQITVTSICQAYPHLGLSNNHIGDLFPVVGQRGMGWIIFYYDSFCPVPNAPRCRHLPRLVRMGSAKLTQRPISSSAGKSIPSALPRMWCFPPLFSFFLRKPFFWGHSIQSYLPPVKLVILY